MKKTNNCVLVIFGASGDLTFRKLIPAVFDLYLGKFLPENFAVLGVSRTAMSDDEFRSKVVFDNKEVKRAHATEEQYHTYSRKIFYQAIDTQKPEDYAKLKTRLQEIDSLCNTEGNYVYYMSTPPSLYEVIPASLKAQDLTHENNGWRRLIVEKPFGYDLATAKDLNKKLLNCFDEDQIYRIDHYLGKETVQNLLVTRFSNSIFEPLWNRNYIQHIEITAAETVGVEKRGGYYDTSGATRDMVQNHLLQVASIVAMEPPVVANSRFIRSEQVKVFQSLRPMSKKDIEENVIRGQYTQSTIKGQTVKGYRQEEGVPAESRTETYVAMKFFIDNWRWAGVPFYIRTGKKLPTRATEVVIQFKNSPHHLFAYNEDIQNQNNQLIIRIQPDEGILLKFGMKVPGAGFKVKTVNMDFRYSDLSDHYVPGAYERLLLDCVQGDSTLYARGDAVESAWEFIDPILKEWEENRDLKIYGYPAGTWGPTAADRLMEDEGMGSCWRFPAPSLTDDATYCEL
ncbi:MAG: glucose-6-phosphate dehydrogenase [Cytophagaceae bacterium]|jgi:glucose-6-phosphate 1-dehydrogenase|nr:glucose-6-phosphate dehydrogenase [Cytophagaceae bacterium]